MFSDVWWTSPDGLSLHGRDYPGDGSKAPVICLHGLSRNARDFEDIAPRLQALGRRVLVLEMRGRGASAWDPNPLNYLPPTYVGDVLALMDKERIGKAVFLGTSMGALIALLTAAMRPDVVAGLILNDAGPETDPAGIARIMRYVGVSAEVADWQGAADYIATLNGDVFPDFTGEDWMTMARRTFKDGPDGRPVLDYDPDISAPLKAADPGAPAPDLWPLFQMAVAAKPTLVLRGETSDILSAATAQRMTTSGPQVTLAEIPRVGHAPTLSEPAAVAAIETFLETAP